MRHNTLAKIWGVFFVCFCSIFGTKKNTPHFVLDRFCTGLGPAPNKSFSSFNYILRAPSGPLLTLLGPQSRFGDKLLIIRVPCPHIWECGAKGVKHPRRSIYQKPAVHQNGRFITATRLSLFLLPSDNVQHDLQHGSLINFPKEENLGNKRKPMHYYALCMCLPTI